MWLLLLLIPWSGSHPDDNVSSLITHYPQWDMWSVVELLIDEIGVNKIPEEKGEKYLPSGHSRACRSLEKITSK